MTMDKVNQVIHESFSKSTDNDLLILYYAGHNAEDGSGLFFGETEGFLYPFNDLLIKLNSIHLRSWLLS